MDLAIVTRADSASTFLGLLTPAFEIRARTGIGLKTFVCDELGVEEDYFDNRIQTLFLNSKPVDNADTAVVSDGAVLALSAAMPGLVGATFRKGGRYSWMRKVISHEGQAGGAEKPQGRVSLKLFNLVLKELGPDFLRRGVWVPGQKVRDFFKDASADCLRHIQAMTLDGAAIAPQRLSTELVEDAPVFVKVHVEP